jgi:DNA-binding LytR/AlgR family response regulator
MNCIIVDDDPLYRKAIEKLIKKSDILNLIGICTNADEAIKFVEKNKNLDLIFLDVEMPEMSGIEFVKTFNIAPQIIIVSSNKDYAAEAFEYNVTDFLTKPVEYNRFLKSVLRAKEVNESLRGSHRVNTKGDLYIKKDSRLIHINERDIIYIEALADYVTIHCTNNEKHTILSTMKAIEFKLNSEDFARIHRSYIIHLEKIKEIEDETLSIGDKVLPISRSQKPILFQKLHLL